MAYGGSNLLDDFEATLTCPVCLEILENPQTLTKCQHVLCLACTEGLLRRDQTIICPVCREENKIENKKSNVVLKQLIENFKKTTVSAKSEGQKLENCSLCERKSATKYCFQCKRVLCEICVTSHTKISTCKMEESKDIQEIKENAKQDCIEQLEKVEQKLNELEEQEKKELKEGLATFDERYAELLTNYQKELEILKKKYKESQTKLHNERSSYTEHVQMKFKDAKKRHSDTKSKLLQVIETEHMPIKKYLSKVEMELGATCSAGTNDTNQIEIAQRMNQVFEPLMSQNGKSDFSQSAVIFPNDSNSSAGTSTFPVALPNMDSKNGQNELQKQCSEDKAALSRKRKPKKKKCTSVDVSTVTEKKPLALERNGQHPSSSQSTSSRTSCTPGYTNQIHMSTLPVSLADMDQNTPGLGSSASLNRKRKNKSQKYTTVDAATIPGNCGYKDLNDLLQFIESTGN